MIRGRVRIPSKWVSMGRAGGFQAPRFPVWTCHSAPTWALVTERSHNTGLMIAATLYSSRFGSDQRATSASVT